MTQHCLKNKGSMWNHLNKQRRGVALQCIHKPRLISIQTEIKRLSQVQYIIAFSSKNSLSHHHRPFFLTTINIIVQLETENNSPSGEENYITMTTQKKFNYQEEGADAVLIVCVAVCACVLPQPISVAPSSSWHLLLIGKAWTHVVLSVWVWANKTWEGRSFRARPRVWPTAAFLLSTVCNKGLSQPLIGSGEVIWWDCRSTLDCHNASQLTFAGWLHSRSYPVQILPYRSYRSHNKRRNKLCHSHLKQTEQQTDS